jgi:hypothetical protein
MELSIIDGNFPKQDAERIVKDIFDVKILYHQNRLQSNQLTVDERLRSETRIQELENNLQKLLNKIRAYHEEELSIRAHIELSIFAPITQ